MDFEQTAVTATPADEARTIDRIDDGFDLVEDELLVEEISIDGMCGVY
ncbi:MAG: mycofactocin precursor MftA [Acidimicrobiales bacterium]